MSGLAERAAPTTSAGTADSRPVMALEALLDQAELLGLGWDPVSECLTPDPLHPQLGYRGCSVAGCVRYAHTGRQHPHPFCTQCALRWDGAQGEDAAAFCARGGADPLRHPALCLVCRTPGHERPAGSFGLCFSCNTARRAQGQSVSEHVAGDERFAAARPRVSFGRCRSATCGQWANARRGLCNAHHQRWTRLGRPELEPWCRVQDGVRGGIGGRVSLRGLPRLVQLEVLFGIVTCAKGAGKCQPHELRASVEELRRRKTASIMDDDWAKPDVALSATGGKFLRLSTRELRFALGSIDDEIANDVWDLRLWGQKGRLSFSGPQGAARNGRDTSALAIRQPWLRAGAKLWAVDHLARSGSGDTARRVVATLGLLAESLCERDDRGEVPSQLGRPDMERFLASIGRLARLGRISTQTQVLHLESLSRFLRDSGNLGLTAEEGPMAGLSSSFALHPGDRVRRSRFDPEAPGEALPQWVMNIVLDPGSLRLLEAAAGADARRWVQIQAEVGRRTAELSRLPFDCLGYDEQVDEVGGLERLPVLIHDMPKVHVKGRRLPIVEDTAALIREQQVSVRDRFPDTRAADLALFPTTKLNPRGETSIQGGLMAKRIHRWARSLAPLCHPDTGEEFPAEKIHPYAFRHTYAQRLADNGTNLEVLAALMGHSDMETTRTYYRVTAKRKREAIRAVASLQLDKNGRKTRSLAVELAESEEYRDHIGQVAVVFGSCVEPHNVGAHGRGCPFRHQCFGCSHFRTDPSYLPELRNHLAALLADKERLRSELPQLEDWARRDAMPSDEEIESVRRLIGDCEAELEELDPVDRARITELVQTLRRGRRGLSDAVPVELTRRVSQPEPSLFPGVARERGRTSEQSA
jgi:integrase